MQIEKVVKVNICDVCGNETFGDKCIRCEIDHCYDCAKKLGVNYHGGVFSYGSNDGYYCLNCDKILTQKGSNKLHSAYKTIKNLSDECETFNKRLGNRAKQAEDELTSLLRKRGKIK